MEETSIRDSINLGKANWQTMQKRFLKEETDQMGGSDVSAIQPLSTGEKPETMQHVSNTISDSGETPEYKNLKKDILLGISKAKKDQVTKLARLFPKPQNNSLEDFIDTIASLKNELSSEKEKLQPILSQNIEKYNSIVDTALTHALGSMGLAVERMKLPNVNNINDLRNIAIFYGDYDNIIQDVSTHLKPILSKNILGASLMNEAFTGKRNVQQVGDTLSSLSKIKDRIPNKLSQVIRESGLIKYLGNTFLIAAKIETLDALIKGFEQKLQRLEASKASKDALKAKQDAELIVLDPSDFGVTSDEPTSSLDENKIVSRMLNGPGKISQIQEEDEVDDGIMDESINRFAKNKKLLNESWKKVSNNSNKLSKDIKADDFTLLMG